MAYFYLNKVNLQNCQFPFLFITGDEIFFDEITPKALMKVLNIEINNDLKSVEIFKIRQKLTNIQHKR